MKLDDMVLSFESRSEIPDVCIFQARIGPVHPQQLASLAKTKCDFNLIYRYGPGTAHANINHCLDRCTSRYVVICDDDVEFLDESWLTTLINVLKENEEVGQVVPVEIKSQATRDAYVQNGWCDECKKPEYDLLSCSWLPGYVMAFDMTRTPDIRADEKIPGPSGMSDLDLSLQVREAGYKCLFTTRTVVFHGVKPLDVDWRMRWDIVQETELPALHQQQVAYMDSKWGPFFRDSIGRKFCGHI